MSGKHLTKTREREEDGDDGQTWLNWCRLCAKREETDQENSSILLKNDSGKLDSELATSIGKYFWVNIKADDGISQRLCLQCKQLIEELIIFTERVNKVQTMFCLLQNLKPTSADHAYKLRSQCGLIDEGWQHIIKPEQSKVEKPAKPLLIDRQVQTDLIIFSEGMEENKNLEISSIDTKEPEGEIIEVIQKTGQNEEYESNTEIETEHTYEYIMQMDNDMELIESGEYITESTNRESSTNHERAEESEDEEEDDVQDSDLFKEFKFKIEDDEEEQKFKKKFKISEQEEVEVEYQESPQLENQEDTREMVESLEILEEEDEDDYVNTGENDAKNGAFLLLKGKRGRPFASKKSDSDSSSYRYECKECKRRYKNPNIYRKHMRSLHDVIIENLPDFMCSICNKDCFTESRLKMHMRHHLPDEEKLTVPCPYCDRKFSQVGAMRQHVNGIHHQMKPYICDQCGRACKTMAALNEHQLVHTNECPFECDVCHKRFKNKPRLKSHMDTHTNSAYQCPDCGLELNTRRTLLQHRLVHSDVKRFKCEFCEAAFKRSKALKNHLILHTGLRPYKCNFCNRAFSNGSNCRAHKKRAHPKELAEEEAKGKVAERVPIPKLEELKSAKGVLVQPRKVKRHAGGLPNHLRKLLLSAEKRKKQNPDDLDDPTVENYDNYSDFQYEIGESEIEETEGMADNPNEECEETVIYEIIDEI